MRRAVLAYLGDPTGTDQPLALNSLREYALSQPATRDSWEIEVRVFPHGASPAAVARTLYAAAPDLLGFSVYVWNVAATRATTRAFGRLAGPAVPVVWGGPEAYPEAARLLAEVAEIRGVCLGEGEQPFADLLVRCADPGGGADAGRGLAGWAWTDGRGGACEGPEAPPFPVERLPVLYRPGNEALVRAGGPVLLETSRGCPFACRFCYWSGEQLGARMRYRPLEAVEAELDFALSRGPRELFLIDSELNSTVEHARRVLEVVVRARERHAAARGTALGLHLLLGVGRLDAEVARLLARARTRVIVGIQSLNPAALRRMARGWSRQDRFREELRLLDAAGNRIYNFDLIYGLPGDDLAHFRDGVREVLEGGHRLWAGPLLVLPGTAFRERAGRDGLAWAPEPPYEVMRADGWEPADLDRARHLAIGIDLHNRVGEGPVRAAAVALGVPWLELLEGYGRAVDDGVEPGARHAGRGAWTGFAGHLAGLAGPGTPLGAWAAEMVRFWEDRRRAFDGSEGAPRPSTAPADPPPLPAGARLRVAAPVLFRSFRFHPRSFSTGSPEGPGATVLFSPALAEGWMEVPPGLPALLKALDGGNSIVGSEVPDARLDPAWGVVEELFGAGILAEVPAGAPASGRNPLPNAAWSHGAGGG